MEINYDKDFEKVLTELQTNFGWINIKLLPDSYRDLLNDTIKAVKNCSIHDSMLSLPDDFWYYDEHNNEVYLVGVVNDWCVVENRITKDTWVEPFEFVNFIYNDSLKGNEY